MWFETNIDNYGEMWIDGQIDRSTGVIVGLNAQHRVEVSGSAVAGARHVIACLVLNGPLAEPGAESSALRHPGLRVAGEGGASA